MNKIYRISNVDEVKIIQVIEVKSIVGKGIAEDPCRQIIEYYNLDGTLLARYNNREELRRIVNTKEVEE